MLQDFTYPEIKLYASSKLQSNPGYEILKDAEPKSTEILVEGIVKKSSRVFLLVSLLLELLTASIADGDRFSDLEAMLEGLPLDLEDFLDEIIDRLELKYKLHAFELFQLVHCALCRAASLVT